VAATACGGATPNAAVAGPSSLHVPSRAAQRRSRPGGRQ
jgi:hypothetical protein